MDAIRLLTDDHVRLRALFSAYARATGGAERRDIAGLVEAELSVHVAVEREVFYRALADAARRELEDEADPAPARVERQAAFLELEALVHHLRSLLAASAPYEPDFARLRDLTVAHCQEEEALFMVARRRLGEHLERIGWLLATRRAELVAELGPAASW